MTIENTTINSDNSFLHDLTKDDSLQKDINNLSLIDITNLHDKSNEDGNVYFESIFTGITDVNKKLDKMSMVTLNNDLMRDHYCEIYKLLCKRKIKDAMEYVESLCIGLSDERILTEKNKYKKAKYDELKAKIRAFLNVINKRFAELKLSFAIVKERIKAIDTEEPSKEDVKIVERIKNVLQCENIVDEVLKMKDTIKSLNTENNNLNNKIQAVNNDAIANEVKELQEQNLRLQNEINKLTEKNYKLKKECVLYSNEIGTLKEAYKRKQRTVEKQNKVIELMQNKIGDCSTGFEFPIEELKDKIKNLRIALQGEKSEKSKAHLMREMIDYEKRLNDFVNFKGNI